MLVQGKVRDETVANQFDRMNQKMQKEIQNFKRILLEPAKNSDICENILVLTHVYIIWYISYDF